MLDEEVVSLPGAQKPFARHKSTQVSSRCRRGSEASTASLQEVCGHGCWRNGVTRVDLLVACATQLVLRAATGGPGIAITLEGTCWETAELGGARGVLHGGWRQPMSPAWEHPCPICSGRGSWAAASATGSGEKGAQPSPSTERGAGTAAPGQEEMLFAATFAPSKGFGPCSSNC